MNKLQDVTYCGLYCRLCSTKFRVPETATALKDTLASDGWLDFGEQIMPDFKTFWAVLNRFSDFDKTCPSCREGCGDPGCKIRICAKERKVDICPDCEEYPCEHIQTLAQRYPNLVPDGFRMKRIGIDFWISDEVFFIFDAHLFSCKSIFEKNVFFKGNNISIDLGELLKDISREYIDTLHKRFLKVARNEVTHLNSWGSGFGSMVQFSKTTTGFKFKIPTNFRDSKNNNLCMTDLTKAIFSTTATIVSKIFDIIATETIRRYGKPIKNTSFNFGNNVVTLSDFNLIDIR